MKVLLTLKLFYTGIGNTKYSQASPSQPACVDVLLSSQNLQVQLYFVLVVLELTGGAHCN